MEHMHTRGKTHGARLHQPGCAVQAHMLLKDQPRAQCSIVIMQAHAHSIASSSCRHVHTVRHRHYAGTCAQCGCAQCSIIIIMQVMR